MATTITVQKAPDFGQAISGLTFTIGDTAGMNFVNDGKTILVAKNTDAVTDHNLLIVSTSSSDSGRLGDVDLTITAEGYAVAGPFKTSNWNTASGSIEITPANTSLEIAVVSYKDATSN